MIGVQDIWVYQAHFTVYIKKRLFSVDSISDLGEPTLGLQWKNSKLKEFQMIVF